MSDAKRLWRGLVVVPALACMVMVGCGDDEGDDDVDLGDGGNTADTGIADGGRSDGSVVPSMDGGNDGGQPNIDAGTDAGPQQMADSGLPYRSGKTMTDQTIVIPLSANGDDRFFAVTYDSTGKILATGFRSEGKTADSDTELTLARFYMDGGLDTTFGDAGLSAINVSPGGRALEAARGVVVQADGKIVVAGEIDHEVFLPGVDAGVIANDKDIALVRFLPNGQLDMSFGMGGIVRENVGDAVVTERTTDAGVVQQLTGADSLWSLARTADDKLVLHLSSLAQGTTDAGPRRDTDYTLVRLNADGTRDTTFNGTGVLHTDFGQVSASARTAVVLPDRKIIGTGYTMSSVLTNGMGNAQQPVLYKVNENGTPDVTFAADDRTATPGVWHDYARADRKNAEAYTAGQQGSKLVTIGYGPTGGTGTGTDWVLLRFTGEGALDTTFGVGGVSLLDPGGYSDNGRGLAVLPDNSIIGVGVGRAKPAVAPAMGMPARDGMIGVFGPDGQPDESFAPGGYKLYALGGDVDELHNVAVSSDGSQAAVVGVKGAADAAGNADAVLILLDTGL